MKLKFKKGYTVKVISGDDRGKSGEIIEIFNRYRATVKGLNMVKKHTKPTKEKKGGIVSIEKSIHLSNLSVVDADKKVTKGKKEESKKTASKPIDMETKLKKLKKSG